MKKFLPYILILVILVGLFSPVLRVYASPINKTEPCVYVNGELFTEPPCTATATAPANAATTPNTSECYLLQANTWDNCISYYILAPLAYIIFTVTAFILWLAGVMLNFVLDMTVVKMSVNIKTMTGINIAWKVIRDLMNIAFIFILVYEGILLIIAKSDITKVKNIVVGFVLASILINFSLFFTKVMIDASNIMAIGFYNSILDNSTAPGTCPPYPAPQPPGCVPGNTTNNRSAVSGLSVPFMNALGLTSWYSGESFASVSSAVGGGTNMLIFFLMGSVVFTVVSFCFFAASVLFVIRYVTLLVLLMLSPVAYMGMALPFMQSYSKDWWESFKGQLLFAPIYMLMTWVILTLMTSTGFIVTGNWGVLLKGTEGNAVNSGMSLIFNFVVIIGLLILSLITAKKTASQGSQLIGQATGKLSAFAGGAIMGGAARGLRSTVGAGASRLAQSQRFQNFAGRSAIGEKLLKGTRGVAGGSFDARASRIGQQMASATSTDFGKAKEGGFDRTIADKTTRKEKFGQSLQGDVAKRAYAVRQAAGIGVIGGAGVRGGSRSNTRTIFGTMGRSNRVVASRTLNNQITPLETLLETQRTNLTNQQNTDTNLNQQLVNLASELQSLLRTPTATRTPQMNARIAQLTSPTGPVANLNAQIAANTTRMTNTNAQIDYLENDPINGVIARRAEINALGIDNPNNLVPLTPQQLAANAGALATGTPINPRNIPRPTRADEQQY